MPNDTEAVNRTLEEYRAYLETLSMIQIDPRLRAKFDLSDVVQDTLMEAWQDVERIEALDPEGRKRWLRRMLVNNLIEAIRRYQTKKRDVRREKPLGEALDESSDRLGSWLADEDSLSGACQARHEEGLRLLEALAKLDERQRQALILQKYHGWTLAQIANYLGCTAGVVAGLHARGLKGLRKLLSDEMD